MAEAAKSLIKDAVRILIAAGVESASTDARILLQFATGITREELLRDPDQQFPDRKIELFTSLIRRRATREPVSHLLGRREFWGLSFVVNADVLDPRPDSETLIEALLGRLENKSDRLRILDLGTGSGCLLLSLLHELPNAWGLGIDLSEKALVTARGNAEQLEMSSRATFCRAIWTAPLTGVFDIVISNPPYIEEEQIVCLAPEVRQHEPRIALSGGHDGLQAYREIARDISSLMVVDGWLAVECGAGQWSDVASIFATDKLRAEPAIDDLGGVARVFLAQAIEGLFSIENN